MSYDGNQLVKVMDDGYGPVNYSSKHYQDLENAQKEMFYDQNGALIADFDRNICTIRNNLLTLPDTIQFSNGNQIVHHYDAMGRKRSTTYRTLITPTVVPVGSVLNLPSNSFTSQTTYYSGNMELIYGSPGTYWKYHTPVGYTMTDDLSGEPSYYYYVHDHLGNVCAVWSAETNSFVQKTFYYPSGVPMYNCTNQALQPNKYNGKPYEEMHGFDIYEYEFRNYYATIMRFTAMDPLCEQTPWQSPYAYAANNPVCNVDWMGLYSGNFSSGFNTILNWAAMDSEGNYIASGDDNGDHHVYLVDGCWDGTYSSLSRYKIIGWEILGQNYIVGKPFYWIASRIASVSSGSGGGWTITADYVLMYGNHTVGKIHIIDSNTEALFHYLFGDGTPRRNGWWSQKEFMKEYYGGFIKRIENGLLSDYGIIDMQPLQFQFYIGNTTYMYYLSGSTLFIAYGIGDGFWDPLLLDDDKYKQEHPEWVSDKKGPEFEIPLASPYDFIPSLIIKRF